MTVLQLSEVSKQYGDGRTVVKALQGVSLNVAQGEMVAIMGPSGSGKSTLLTIAGGLEQATSGSVMIDGLAATDKSRNQWAELRRSTIGYVFQELNLLMALTAAENVALPAELDGVSASKAKEAAVKALERVGIGELHDRFPDDLSGGERQRVAIARAMARGQKLILADEPTGALDSINGEAVMRLIRRACEQGAAAAVVTHNSQLAAWADRVVFLRDGRAVDATTKQPGPECLLDGER